MTRNPTHARHISSFSAMLLVLAALAGCSIGESLPDPIPVETIAPYPGNLEPPLLVDAESVRSRLEGDDGRLVVLDASDLRTYRAGHIPGAVHAWWQDTMNPNGPAYGTVLKPDENQPDPQHLRRTFVEDLGVTRESDVVVYDNEQNRRAARIVWTLRFFGYSRVAVLDGGLAAWRGAEGSLETRENSPADVPQPPIDPQQKADWYLVTGELMSELTDPDLVLLDSRTEDERADDVDETIDPGSIPNSVEAPWTSTMSDTHGHFLSPPELRALFESAGVTPNRRIVIYARFGVETAHTWLALKLLGYEHVLIYDSGWVDWAQRPDTPKQPLLQ